MPPARIEPCPYYPIAEPHALMFADDGSIPNNPLLPFLVYRGAIDLSGTPDPEQVIEKTFARHGWGDMWRNGIYPYVHYHSRIHEALGIARGRARVRFGGAAGDRARAGGGRRRGAARRHRPPVPVGRARALRHRRLSEERQIRPLPRQQGRARRRADQHPHGAAAGYGPVHGQDGPLTRLWRERAGAL